jgi:hypothetical protein
VKPHFERLADPHPGIRLGSAWEFGTVQLADEILNEDRSRAGGLVVDFMPRRQHHALVVVEAQQTACKAGFYRGA